MELKNPIYGNYVYKNGIYLPENLYKRKPTGFDFFAGVGGFSLGFIQAGYKVVGAMEIDTAAAHTYMVNLGSHPIKIHYTSQQYKEKLTKYFDRIYGKSIKKQENKVKQFIDISGSGWISKQGNDAEPVNDFFFGDIREVTGQWVLNKLGMKKGELGCIMGGPPCQGFSRANSKNIDEKKYDPRNNLVFEFARMIVEMAPKTFVMEDVPDILKMITPQGIPILHVFGKILEDGAYMPYNQFCDAIGFTEKEIFAVVRQKSIKSTRKEKPDKEKIVQKTLF